MESQLHFRHGCIIVRGGKIIGKGYNHYRPGFNGGALKNGRLATKDALVELKQKQKRHKSKQVRQSSKHAGTTPFGGGHLANSPLSMHSEMMAIRSALSLSAHDSGSSARSTAWCEIPSFKLPASSKRKQRLQRINEYVKAVCDEAKHAGGRMDLYSEAVEHGDESRFEPATCGLRQVQQLRPQQNQGGRIGEPGSEEGKGKGEEEAGEDYSSRRSI